MLTQCQATEQICHDINLRSVFFIVISEPMS